MSKHSVVFNGVGSLLTFLAGIALYFIAAVGHQELNSGAFLGMLAFFMTSLALGFAAWLLGLMKTAGISRWDWFVLVLFLGMPGALLYGIRGPAGRTHILVSTERQYQGAHRR